MEEQPVDLTALDAMSDRLRFERMVRRVMTAAAPELRRRAAGQAPLALLGAWARPMLAAAAVVAVLAGGVLMATERAGAAAAPLVTAEDLGVPAPAADWLAEGREPTRADLVLAMESRR
jgi:hypothetical protein